MRQRINHRHLIQIVTLLIFFCIQVPDSMSQNTKKPPGHEHLIAVVGDKAEGVQLFEKGNDMLKKSYYALAENLYTKAMESFPDPNVFFNRGVSRLFQQDTIGFCDDLEIAGHGFGDTEAIKLLNQHCCLTVDTVILDRRLNRNSSKKARYLEEIKYYRYSNDTIGVIHDLKKKHKKLRNDINALSKHFNLGSYETDIIGIYMIKNNSIYYTESSRPASLANLETYDIVKDELASRFNQKYKSLKLHNILQEVPITYELYISKEGDIMNIDVYSDIFKIKFDDYKKALEEEMLKTFKEYCEFIPSRLNRTPVNYVISDFIIF